MYKDNATTGGRSIPAWVIFDAHFRFNYAMGPLMPGQVMPDSRLRKEWLNTVYWKADTLDALAGQIGVDAAGLAATVQQMNDYARSGIDKDFARGGNPFDRYYGDVNVKPNPCLAPIAKGPSTPCASTPATSAPRAACSPTPRPRWSARTAAPSPASTPSATPRPR
jgi:3-oxosteroid 1-dehydrogenase